MTITSINPSTERLLASFGESSTEETELTLSELAAAFERWRQTSFAQRSALMRRAAAVLRERKERYAALMTGEMGKPPSSRRKARWKSVLGAATGTPRTRRGCSPMKSSTPAPNTATSPSNRLAPFWR